MSQEIEAAEVLREAREGEERRNERLLQAIFDHAPVGIEIFDREGISRRMNLTQSQLFGLPSVDAVSGRFNVRTDPMAVSSGASAQFERALLGESVPPWDQVVSLPTAGPDGRLAVKRVVLNRLFFPVHDERGEIDAVISIAWDNTARSEAERALRETESRLWQILEALPVGVLVHGRGGGLVYSNEVAQRILWNGSELRPLVRAGTREPYPPAHLPGARALRGEISEVDDVEVDAPEQSIPLLVSGSPVVDEAGKPQLAVSVFVDLTETRRLARTQDEFVSTVSHELRTPLTSIRGSLSLLSAEVGGPIPERMRPLLDIALRNTERLLVLINDLLDIQRLEAGFHDIVLEEAELGPLVERALEDNQTYSAQQGVTFRVVCLEPDLRVRADARRFFQVMANLLSNAAKFSPPRGEVEVGTARVGGWARISVRDHGPGIPEEFRSRIFSRFAQADASTTRSRGGTGLGLSISKELVDLMGGRLTFETALGRGTTFHLDLPALRRTWTGQVRMVPGGPAV